MIEKTNQNDKQSVWLGRNLPIFIPVTSSLIASIFQGGSSSHSRLSEWVAQSSSLDLSQKNEGKQVSGRKSKRKVELTFKWFRWWTDLGSSFKVAKQMEGLIALLGNPKETNFVTNVSYRHRYNLLLFCTPTRKIWRKQEGLVRFIIDQMCR